jgi:hypothetical protein
LSLQVSEPTFVDVGDDEAGTLTSEDLRGSAAYTLRCPCDDRRFAL